MEYRYMFFAFDGDKSGGLSDLHFRFNSDVDLEDKLNKYGSETLKTMRYIQIYDKLTDKEYYINEPLYNYDDLSLTLSIKEYFITYILEDLENMFIVNEYVDYYMSKYNNNAPNNAQIVNFKKETIKDVKHYINRGLSIRNAIEKVHRNAGR